ncbi:MAG: hypothetical protein LBR08_00945 [Bacteroidales bacterium]|jgi:hypothetical protein|nr:hypothetical protein [Bacteroidales bacterium]
MMKYSVLLWAVFLCSCNKDTIPEPYQPVDLPHVSRIDFIAGSDSSVFVYDGDMLLRSGRNHTADVNERERFAMQYSENNRLSGAEYEVVQGLRLNPVAVTYSRDERNMLSKVTREGWNKTFTFSYDDHYRLHLITVTVPEGVNRYTVTYDGQSNVAAVELYQKISETEGITKWTYGEYDAHPNPFRFLVNVFFAPAFSSGCGAVRYDNLPLGMLLSVNNPGKVTEERNGENNLTVFRYEYGEDNFPEMIFRNDDVPVVRIKYYKAE